MSNRTNRDDPPDELADGPRLHTCDNGWKNVGDGYVNKLFEGRELTDERRDQIGRDTVYPCKDCNPDLFFRWLEGHLEKDHDRRHCEECSGRGDRRRHAPGRRRTDEPTDRQRADLA